MWFKNLQVYRLPSPWLIPVFDLVEQLAKKRFQPCGSQDMESRGWVSPTGEDMLVHAVGGQWLIALGIERKLLPSSVVRHAVCARAVELTEQQGYKPGRRQLKELREQIIQELLPRAFIQRRRIHAWIDPVQGWLVVDASSPARAEDVLELLRQTLDSFPLAVLRTERSPTSAMADWLASGKAPAGFTLDEDFALQSVTEDKAKAVFTHHNLEAAHVREHLEAGKLPTRLAMTFDDRVSFVLTERLELRRIDFLDVVREKAKDAEDAIALFNAEFALMTGELQRLLPAVVGALGGEQKLPDVNLSGGA